MSEKLKEVVKEEMEQAKVLAVDAARSAAYLYPLKARPSHTHNSEQRTL